MKFILTLSVCWSFNLVYGSSVWGRNRRPCSIRECSTGLVLDPIKCVCNPGVGAPLSSNNFESKLSSVLDYANSSWSPERSESSTSEFTVPSSTQFSELNSSGSAEPSESSSSSKLSLDSSSSIKLSCAPCPSENFVQNPETCECICNILCTRSFDSIPKINNETCECEYKVCYVSCDEGFIVDWETCTNLCHGCPCIPDPRLVSVKPSLILSSIFSGFLESSESSSPESSRETSSPLDTQEPRSSFESPDSVSLSEYSTLSYSELSIASHSTQKPSCPPCHSEDFIQNSETCECMCNVKCRDDFALSPTVNNETCECEYKVCAVWCKKGFINKGCSCVPDPSYSSSPSASYFCDLIIICEEGMIFDPNVCACVVDSTPICPEGFIYDNNVCECVCEEIKECSSPWMWSNSTCECFCPREVDNNCPDGKIFDFESCQCVCEDCPDCTENQFLNEETCKCECHNRHQCENGFIFDGSKCLCVASNEVSCPPGFVYDSNQCDCVCEKHEKCQEFQVFDELVCKCV